LKDLRNISPFFSYVGLNLLTKSIAFVLIKKHNFFEEILFQRNKTDENLLVNIAERFRGLKTTYSMASFAIFV
jgi:hypothetical protein